MTPIEIHRALSLRNVELNDGIGQVEYYKYFPIPEYISQIHGLFDGFASWDEASFIDIWSLDRIMTPDESFKTSMPPGHMVIGDVLIGSDFLVVDMMDMSRPVTLLYEKAELSNSYYEFWQDLIEGRFDRT